MRTVSRRLALPLCLVLAAGLLGACSDDDDATDGTTTSTSGPGVTVQASTTRVEAGDFAFTPTTVNVKAGAPVALRVANKGKAPHTFTIDALHVDQQVGPGEEVEVLVQAPTAATHTFYCRFHRSQMEGTLTAA